MKSGPPLLRRTIGPILKVLDQEKFLTQTVRKVLFGAANPLIKLANDVLPPDQRWPYQLYGLFVGKNASTDAGTLEVLSGLHPGDSLGQIVAVNGKKKLDWWSGQCNDFKLSQII